MFAKSCELLQIRNVDLWLTYHMDELSLNLTTDLARSPSILATMVINLVEMKPEFVREMRSGVDRFRNVL